MRHDSQAIETGRTGLKDLGRLDPVDLRQLASGGFLWGRFHVLGEPQPGASSVVVQDADGELGDPPAHRLQLHLVDAPEHPEQRARLGRAWAVRSRLQPRVYATGLSGSRIAVFAEPTASPGARPLPSAALHESERQLIAVELAGLLTKLHEAEVRGVRFELEQIRVEDGHYSLGGFAHLLPNERPRTEDVNELVASVRELVASPDAAEVEIPSFATAAALWDHLRRSDRADFDEFELPAELPFVGREQALAALEAGISDAQIAKPSAIVVEGERGIGKSRLLREFVGAHFKSDNVLVLTGTWHVQSGDTRSGLLGALEQLPRVLPRLDPDERDEIRRRINRATKHLGAIVTRSAPALGSVLRHAEELPQLELGGDFSRHTAVIADVLKSIGTRQRPLLLVLDNVENVDANSAAVLEIITQVRPAHYTLVVMGLLTGAQGYEPEFPCERIKLRPLDEAEVGELLTRTFEGTIEEKAAIASVLHAATRGNPLALGARLRAWLDQQRLSRGVDGVWRARKSLRDELDAEPNVRDLFEFRFAGAADSVKQAALRIAVLGIELRNEYLVDIADEIDAAIDDLASRGIVVRTNTGVRFPHDSVRELVLDAFSPEDRRRAHRRAAEILTKHEASIPQIVYHRDFGFEAETATPEAFDRLSRLHVEAGRNRLDVYDLERARWHLERALEHSHDPEQRGLAAEGLADICLLQDDLDTAVSLYTAIIATATPTEAVRVAAKAVPFLYSKSVNRDAWQLGLMALETASEPTPTSTLGKLWTLMTSVVRSWTDRCELEYSLRDGLCRLYMYLLYIALLDDPVSVPMFAARGRWIAIGLDAGSAAISRSLEAGLLTVLGFVKTADRIFELSNEIAQNAKDVWSQGMVFHHWGGALLALDRYSDGQDRLDDAIGAFRESGEIAIALLAIYYKSMYGRDREHANTVLGWVDEALTTARRHGKRYGVSPLQSVKLHVLARSGQTEIRDRLLAQIEVLRDEKITGIERLATQLPLAYACLESANLDLAVDQVRAALAYAKELGPTVPEWCQEVHVVTALVFLERPVLSREDRKLLRQAIRNVRRAIKRAPRLRVFGDLLKLKLALKAGKTTRAHAHASRIVSEFDRHENLHVARQAHRALARLLKGDNVLAAAEHERLARNLGKRLGLADHVLLSDFSELGKEVGVLALTEESDLNLEESLELPAVGMLSASASGLRGKPSRSSGISNDQEDVLAAWALTDVSRASVSLGSIVAPVRDAVRGSIDANNLKIGCSDPELEVSIASSDLQILLVHMLLTCRDAVGGGLIADVRLGATTVDDASGIGQARPVPAGRYLLIEVNARGEGGQVPVFGGFATCETLAQGLGGLFSASTDRGKVDIVVHVPIDAPAPDGYLELPRRVVVVHPDPAIRKTIGEALTELGASWESVSPEAFSADQIEDIDILLADKHLLEEVVVLQPLSSLRLIEIVKRGAEPGSRGHETLSVPFALSELEDRIDG